MDACHEVITSCPSTCRLVDRETYKTGRQAGGRARDQHAVEFVRRALGDRFLLVDAKHGHRCLRATLTGNTLQQKKKKQLRAKASRQRNIIRPTTLFARTDLFFCSHLALEDPRESGRAKRDRPVGVHRPLGLHPGDAAHQPLRR